MEGCHVFPRPHRRRRRHAASDHITDLHPISKREGGMMDTNIEPDALLSARGFPRLAERFELTRIPNPGWFVLLAGIRTFETVYIQFPPRHGLAGRRGLLAKPSGGARAAWDKRGGVIDGIISASPPRRFANSRSCAASPTTWTTTGGTRRLQRHATVSQGMPEPVYAPLARGCLRPVWAVVAQRHSRGNSLKEVLEGRGGKLSGTFHKYRNAG